jgi:hypothetical protein
VIPAVYGWNSDSRQYDIEYLPVEEPAADTPDLRTYMRKQQASEALAITEQELTQPDLSDHDRGRLQYYRAQALEMLDRPDEALAEYVAIYEAAPDSAWGMLATLHLEPIGL